MYLDEPRNYWFFKRLPEIFTALVVEKVPDQKNIDSRPTWYKLMINNNEVHLLSNVPLKPNTSYMFRKKKELRIEIVKELTNDKANNNLNDFFYA